MLVSEIRNLLPVLLTVPARSFIAMLDLVTPRDVSTTLNYFKDAPDGSSPPPIIIGKPETYRGTYEARRVTVHDIRGSEFRFRLDTAGFEIVEHESEEKEFIDIERIKTRYFYEIEELLKEV